CAAVEAARGLLDRRLREVEPDERDQPAPRALRERERAVVRRTEARMAVGLVHAEHERARDPVAVHEALELLVAAGHAVEVVAEMEVRVEDLGAFGQLAAELLVPAFDELLRALERVLHRSSVYGDRFSARLAWRPRCPTS